MPTEYRSFLALSYDELEELNLKAKTDRDMPTRSANSSSVQGWPGFSCMDAMAAPICLSARAKSQPTPALAPSAA